MYLMQSTVSFDKFTDLAGAATNPVLIYISGQLVAHLGHLPRYPLYLGSQYTSTWSLQFMHLTVF